MASAVEEALRREKHFHRESGHDGDGLGIKHQLNWGFVLHLNRQDGAGKSIAKHAQLLDPLSANIVWSCSQICICTPRGRTEAHL